MMVKFGLQRIFNLFMNNCKTENLVVFLNCFSENSLTRKFKMHHASVLSRIKGKLQVSCSKSPSTFIYTVIRKSNILTQTVLMAFVVKM